MKSPQAHAAERESAPTLPPGEVDRVWGYGVMGVPFASGHVLGLRRWVATSVGPGFLSIWHRRPDGTWRFIQDVDSPAGCCRWFGNGAQEATLSPISLDWPAPSTLQVRTEDGSVDWQVDLTSTPMTRAMNAMGAAMPLAAWRSEPVLRAMGAMATRALGAGRLRLSGTTANDQHFVANPTRIWMVASSCASIDGVDAGPQQPLPEQARLGDFWIPQRGIFAMGRVWLG